MQFKLHTRKASSSCMSANDEQLGGGQPACVLLTGACRFCRSAPSLFDTFATTL